MNLTRRGLLAGAAALGAGALLPVTAAGAAPAGFPDYRYQRLALVKSKLKYNPTGELIFPCVRGTAGRIPNALGAYYLYYAPHDAPGGICLAYANSLDQEFTEYAGNPIIKNSWPRRVLGQPRLVAARAVERRRQADLPVLPRREHRHPARQLRRRHPLHLREGGAVHPAAARGHHRDVLRAGVPPGPAGEERALRHGLHAQQHHQPPRHRLGLVTRRARTGRSRRRRWSATPTSARPTSAARTCCTATTARTSSTTPTSATAAA